MLEKTPDSLAAAVETERLDDALPAPERSGGFARRAWHFFVRLSFSSLTRRIIFLNLAGLFALVIGILYLSSFRAGLIEARIQSLLVQGEIIARAIAASATVDPDSVTIDPERLLDLQAGESYDPEEMFSGLDFPINPERVAPVLRELVSPTNTRARIYDRDGTLILDSRALYDVLRFDLPAPEEGPNYFQRRWMALRRWLAKGDLPTYRELAGNNGKGYEEVAQALLGLKWSMVRITDRAEVIVSVAVPVQRFRAVRGALMLSTQGADIDDMVTAERLAIFKVFLVAAGVMVVRIATTTSGSYAIAAERSSLARQSQDTSGPFTIMETLEQAAGSGKTRIVVAGTAAFAQTGTLPPNNNDANLELALGSFQWLAGQDSLIALPPKPDRALPIALTQQDQSVLIFITAFLMPGLTVFGGIMVWWRRRIF